MKNMFWKLVFWHFPAVFCSKALLQSRTQIRDPLKSQVSGCPTEAPSPWSPQATEATSELPEMPMASHGHGLGKRCFLNHGAKALCRIPTSCCFGVKGETSTTSLFGDIAKNANSCTMGAYWPQDATLLEAAYRNIGMPTCPFCLEERLLRFKKNKQTCKRPIINHNKPPVIWDDDGWGSGPSR